MTNEERDLITKFIERVGGQPVAASGFAGSVPGSVPSTGTPPLPPVDAEADRLLSDLFTRYPESRYRVTQLAFVQEHAVAAAANQITQLQAQIAQMQQQMQQQTQSQQAAAPATAAPSPWGQQAQPQAQPQPAPSRGLFGGMFGGGQPAPQPAPQQFAPQQQPYQQQGYAPPPPQYAPGYQPGMFQRSGSGFLGSALTTAAGVAGGMMAANALSGLFSGHHDSQAASFGGGGSGGAGSGGNLSNFGQANLAGEAAPWATPAAGGADPMDQGGEAKGYPAQDAWAQPADTGWQNAAAPVQDTGWQDAAAPAQDSGWQDASNTDSGWSDTSGGSDVDNA